MQKDITLFAQSYKQENESDLQRYLRMVKLHKWKILGFIGFVVAATAVYVSMKTPIYKASTTLLIESQETKMLSIEEVYGLNSKDQEYYLTQFEILKSQDLSERVVRALKLETHPLFDPRQAEAGIGEKLSGFLSTDQELEPTTPEKNLFEKVVRRFMSGLSITPIRNTQLVKISYESPEPELAAKITDTVASQYIKHHLEERQGVTGLATGRLSDRLGKLRETLLESEQRLQAYREEQELVDVRGVQTLGADEIGEITQRYVDAKQQRSRAETLYEQVKELGPNPTPQQFMSISSILGHELVRSFTQAKSQADSRVTELSQRYGPKHPRMIAARTEAQTAGEQLYKQILSVADGVSSNYFAALQTEKSLQQQLSNSKDFLQDVNRKEIRLRELEREVETNRNLYNIFLTRTKETEETKGLQAAHARVIDPAKTPLAPVRPKKTIAVLLALFFSTVFAVGAALFNESLKNTVRSADDVESKLNTTLLGFLPQVKNSKSNLTFRGFLDDSRSHFAESMRTVRTAFVLSSMDKTNKVVLVTSSIPGEGKSTVSLNLAEALSRMERVLLIDGDLRRPSLTKVLGIDNQSLGIADLISGDYAMKDCIHKLKNSQVDIMTAGGTSGVNPLEVVSSKRIAKLLQNLSQHYDRIIIDSPPIHAVSDPLVLSTYADSVIYVVKSDSTSAPVVAKGIKNLKAVGAKIAGVVLNQVDIRRAPNYSADSEHYFTDYGYGRATAVKSA